MLNSEEDLFNYYKEGLPEGEEPDLSKRVIYEEKNHVTVPLDLDLETLRLTQIEASKKGMLYKDFLVLILKKKLESPEIKRLLDITAQLPSSLVQEGIQKNIFKIALEYEGIFDLLEMYTEETDDQEKQNILDDIMSLVEEINASESEKSP